MALPTSSVWEVRPTNGVDTNGGGFVRGGSGTDFSQQNAKNTVGSNISVTDAVTTGIATITSATANFTAAIVDNIVYMTGTGVTTGWYRVVTFTNSTTVILDRSPGTGTGGTLNIGGALKTLTQLNTNMANGHDAWVKAEATISTAAAINWSFTSSTNSFVAGYTTTRGDGGQVTVQASTTSFTIFQVQNNNNLNTFVLSNFILDCNSKSGTGGLATQSFGQTIENINVINYTSAIAFDISQGGSQGIVCRNCWASGGGGTNPTGWKVTANLLGSCFIWCGVINQTGGPGWSVNGGAFINCIAGNISGASSDGWDIQGNSQGPTVLDGCIAYSCGRDGFRWLSSAFGNYGNHYSNLISVLNTGVGFNNTLTAIPSGGIYIDYCYTYGNGTQVTGLTLGSHCVAGSGDPFVAGVSNNYAINSTAGSGAAARGAGYPGVTPFFGTGFRDIGAVQHQDTPTTTTVYVTNRNEYNYRDTEV